LALYVAEYGFLNSTAGVAVEALLALPLLEVVSVAAGASAVVSGAFTNPSEYPRLPSPATVPTRPIHASPWDGAVQEGHCQHALEPRWEHDC
jgi:hypothetical protein